MKELIFNQIVPIITTAIISILVAIIKKIGDAIIALLITKKKEAEFKIESSSHEKELNTAKEIWNIVEEKFRIKENCSALLTSKADEFDKLLLNKIPGLTQDDLDYLRQAIAGEMNKYKNINPTSTSLTNNKNNIDTKDTNLADIPNTNLTNKDTTASSNVQVDNPDNTQLLGATVNAISATVPN